MQVRNRGKSRGGWRFCFHGFEYRFEHERTRQVVEVQLGYADEFGVLDPYFFAEFARSTPGLEGVAGLFRDGFHDPDRALQILEERGRLHRVERSLFQGSGLVAPN